MKNHDIIELDGEVLHKTAWVISLENERLPRLADVVTASREIRVAEAR